MATKKKATKKTVKKTAKKSVKKETLYKVEFLNPKSNEWEESAWNYDFPKGGTLEDANFMVNAIRWTKYRKVKVG